MIATLWSLLRLTLTEPRRGLRAVLAIDPPMPARVAALVLVAVVSALLLHLGLEIAPPEAGNPVIAALVATPFRTALLQGAVLLATAGLIHAGGRVWGGHGTLPEAVLAVAWLQSVFVMLQAAQVAALLLLPPLASLIGLVSVALFLWLLTQFVREIHGFASALKVFFGILATLMAVSFLLTFVLTVLFGPGGPENV